jgi:hypothetical protein
MHNHINLNQLDPIERRMLLHAMHQARALQNFLNALLERLMLGSKIRPTALGPTAAGGFIPGFYLLLSAGHAARRAYGFIHNSGERRILGKHRAMVRKNTGLCYFTPSRRHCGFTAITAGMALRDRSTVRKTMHHRLPACVFSHRQAMFPSIRHSSELCIKPKVEWRSVKENYGRFLPRRDYRTQPRVLALGNDVMTMSTEGAREPRLRRSLALPAPGQALTSRHSVQG